MGSIRSLVRSFAYLSLLIGLTFTLVGLGGCSGGPSPTLAQLYTTTPTQAQVAATATATPTATAPAAAHLPSQAAPETASLTPSPQASATRPPAEPTAEITDEPEPVDDLPVSGPISGPDFLPGVNPLTGLPVSDAAVLERCPAAIKVSNAPAVVRPQAGLNQADLVFEHYAEGGVTRLTAVFLGQTPTMVGSVRSGRLIDLEIPAMFKAIFAYSGTSAGVGELYSASDLWPDQIANPWGTASAAYYRRDLDRPYEHTLFVNPTALWAEAERRGISGRQDLRGLTFDPAPPNGGAPAQDALILYQAGISQVQWVYDASDGRYYRWQGGAAHHDELSGAQLSTANVIVVAANHVETKILEDTWGGGHYSIEIHIWGEGPVSMFRDGQRYDGVWQRWDRGDLLSFWTKDKSQRLPLKPGNSWLQMVPLGFTGLIVSP